MGQAPDGPDGDGVGRLLAALSSEEKVAPPSCVGRTYELEEFVDPDGRLDADAFAAWRAHGVGQAGLLNLRRNGQLATRTARCIHRSVRDGAATIRRAIGGAGRTPTSVSADALYRSCGAPQERADRRADRRALPNIHVTYAHRDDPSIRAVTVVGATDPHRALLRSHLTGGHPMATTSARHRTLRPRHHRAALATVACAALLVTTAPAAAAPAATSTTVDPIHTTTADVVELAEARLEVPRPRTGIERGIEARIFADHVRARLHPGSFGYPQLPPLPPLPWSDAAAEVARSWSDQMAAGPLPDSYRHSPDSWRSSQLQLRDPGIHGAGENIYWIWASSPEEAAIQATRGWMDSDGHRNNLMLGWYGSLGIGVSLMADGTVMATAILNSHVWGSEPPPLRVSPATPKALDGVCATPPSAGFVDIDDAEVGLAVDCLVALGIAKGVDDRRFDPDAELSRQQLATIMVAAFEVAGGTLPPAWSGPRFSDVPDSAIHGDNIRRLAAAGIVSGRGDGSFAPRDDVQRRHVAAFAVASHERLTGTTLPYPPLVHVTDSHSMLFNTPVQIAADRGWDVGDGGRFRPTVPITRAEMALLVARWLEDLDGAR